MARKLLYIWHDDRLTTLPSRATHALAVWYVHTSDRALEWTKYQFVVYYTIKSRPPESHCLMNGCSHITHYGYHVFLAVDE